MLSCPHWHFEKMFLPVSLRPNLVLNWNRRAEPCFIVELPLTANSCVDFRRRDSNIRQCSPRCRPPRQELLRRRRLRLSVLLLRRESRAAARQSRRRIYVRGVRRPALGVSLQNFRQPIRARRLGKTERPPPLTSSEENMRSPRCAFFKRSMKEPSRSRRKASQPVK